MDFILLFWRECCRFTGMVFFYCRLTFKLGKGRFWLYGEKLRSQLRRRPEEKRVSRQLSWSRGAITERTAQIEAKTRRGALSERARSQVNLRRDENNLALGPERYARTHKFEVHQLLRTGPWMRGFRQGEAELRCHLQREFQNVRS